MRSGLAQSSAVLPATPKPPLKAPPQTPPKALTPRAFYDRTRRQPIDGASAGPRRRPLEGWDLQRFGERPRGTALPGARPPRPAARRPAAAIAVAGALGRPRPAERRPPDRIAYSQPPDQPLSGAESVPTRRSFPKSTEIDLARPQRKVPWRPLWGQLAETAYATLSSVVSHPPMKGPFRAPIGTGKFSSP